MYLSGLKTVGLKIEATPYTGTNEDTCGAGDYDFKPYNVQWSMEIETAKRLYAVGDMSAFASIIGKQAGTISFSVDLACAASVSTSPEWGKILQCCGCKETAYTTTGIGWTRNSEYTNIPAAIDACELSEGTAGIQYVVQLRDAIGDVDFVLDGVGQAIRMDFVFKGVLQSVFDRATPLLPASYDTTIPSSVINATISAFGDTLDLDKFTFKMGNKVELLPDVSVEGGYDGAHIVGWEPTFTADPYLCSLATRPDYTRFVAGTTGAIAVAAGTNLTISAPAFQVSELGNTDRAGASVTQITGILTRGAAGNDDFELLQGAKA